ncbi:hypothetical protein WBJ53_29420 [Spirosoma sp. SC4-14]|uniref:hypothetical protein n=1 Tax=Spirosoma sp. SC4-14 TaxID=3128900 RepID=UPI0030CC2A17
MNTDIIKYLIATGLLVSGCQTSPQSTSHISSPQTTTDTITITQLVLKQGVPLNPATNPITRDDAKNFVNSERPDYRIDTLATTGSLEAILISRLYSNESIGWLAIVDRTNKRLLDKVQVYYDNAEGMMQTETKWVPAARRAIVQTGTYDDEGQYKIDEVTYQLTSAGKFVRQ